VSRVELLDEVMMKGINVATGRELPEKPTLMFEFVGSGMCDCPELRFFSLSKSSELSRLLLRVLGF
jgi:hypothetical protein